MRLGGVTELAEELGGLVRALVAAAGPIARTQADQMAENIRAALPVVTGTLRASVQIAPITAPGPAAVAAQVAVTAPYAMAVEFGTAHTAPRPVVVPAQRRGRAAFIKAVVDHVRTTGLQVDGA
jgi:hypothetical protein